MQHNTTCWATGSRICRNLEVTLMTAFCSEGLWDLHRKRLRHRRCREGPQLPWRQLSEEYPFQFVRNLQRRRMRLGGLDAEVSCLAGDRVHVGGLTQGENAQFQMHVSSRGSNATQILVEDFGVRCCPCISWPRNCEASLSFTVTLWSTTCSCF